MARDVDWLLFIVAILIPSAGAAQGPPKVASLGSCQLISGATIPACRVAYRTFGQLNASRDNTVLIPTWLLGRSEEWVPLLGMKGILDTTEFHVVVVDALANGMSSSPSNTAARSRRVFAGLTLGDMVVSQRRLLREHLHLDHLRAVMGFSMGGMQAFEWAVRYPDELDMAISIAGSPKVGTYDRVMWSKYVAEIQRGRQARMKPEEIWNEISHLESLVLRTPAAVNQESWDSIMAQIHSEAETLAKTWSLDDLDAQLRAIRRYDVSEATGGNLSKAALAVRARMLIISSPQDHIVTSESGQAFADLVHARTLSLTGNCGHVALWCERPAVAAAIKDFVSRN
jgi:homoserine acetyltransferase